ncbi:glycoside hydrolase family 2 protein [Paenibacillus montanisoli]|uniref:Glycoside hydrolase family 2 n=1 Tax=Paenibacillus montanisoli TaxID=2081970 RepID=A0A328U3E7_9BACL|nr:sugar-binding domain-containing protein [Paenibacillus montanisoli]RAP74514.1 glycoside hydrolase family 2 [Paenibacillus montanisoli]
MSTIFRTDYPRPQFVRQQWESLNGEWEFEFDDDRIGSKEQWHKGQNELARRIQVPFAFQSKLSGIADNDFHDCVWYRKRFRVTDAFAGKRTILHFGAVDYEATVWVNGQFAVRHEGGHTPFHADITDCLQAGDNWIVVQATDYSEDLTLPRGKQYWLKDSASIFYTRTTGIWQSVWLEAVSPVHLARVRITPDVDRNEVTIRAFLTGYTPSQRLRLRVAVSSGGQRVAEDQYSVMAAHESRTIKLRDFNEHGLGRLWSPEHPNLYDVTFTLLQDGEPVDQVESYFGLRKVSIENGRLCLNNRPYLMKMVLDQGYFPDGNLTPPSDDAIRQDVLLTKAMGFNGARKHQKVEDPRYLYWCDKLGLLVWGEMANAYDYSETYAKRFANEWQEAVERDYNHPCIVAWVPLNESWGVPNIQIDAQQQQHALAMYYMTKSLDATRPVVSNDGWELVKTDLFNIHDYEWRGEVLQDRYSTAEKAVSALPANRQLSVGGFRYEGQPILVTEFGGIAFKKSEREGWGYSGASNDEEYIERVYNVIKPLLASPVVQGYCYTQLTDVEQEINGLLTYDRQPKVPVEILKAINEENHPSNK